MSAAKETSISMNSSDQTITLAHGEGARATRTFITQHIVKRFGNATLHGLTDAAELSVNSHRLAFTTDSYVVLPLAFPGGDIGSLAVYGTVNDLAVAGAKPRWLSVSLIIEEGFLISALDTFLDHMKAAADRCGVMIACGDTKVVPRGAADGLFINTSGLGELSRAFPLTPAGIRAGDILIVSGPIGCHGIAVMAAREKLSFTPAPRSDSAPLHDAVAAVLDQVGDSVRTIRDATRGGVAAVLHEWAADCNLTLQLDEASIPVTDDVRGACELLGLDPVYIANEGTMVVAVDSSAADNALSALRAVPETANAVVIGRATDRKISPVTIQRMLGGEQPIDEPTGAMLPRIC